MYNRQVIWQVSGPSCSKGEHRYSLGKSLPAG